MGNPQQIFFVAFAAILLLVVIMMAAMFYQLFRPWLRAFLSGGKVSLFDIIGMRFRNTPIDVVIDTYITFVQRGEPVPLPEIERCYLSRPGRVNDCHDLIRLVEERRNHSA